MAKKKATKKKATKKATKKKATKKAVKKATKKAAVKKKATKKTATKKAAPKKATKKATAKTTVKKKVEKKKTKRKPNAKFMAPLNVSETLGAVVGNKPLPRTEVTKKLWIYIKKNNLQDSKNRRMINADDKLKAVFGGKASVSMFDMTKHVSKHLTPIA